MARASKQVTKVLKQIKKMSSKEKKQLKEESKIVPLKEARRLGLLDDDSSFISLHTLPAQDFQRTDMRPC